MFKIPNKIKLTGKVSLNGKLVSKAELLKVFVAASERAWLKGIKPKMTQIRKAGVSKKSIKGGGTDFFTKADVASEEIVKRELIASFGKNAFRIFGEEANSYTGNLNSEITIRIDPIDGTEFFKFGKAGWSIMIGAYTGRGSNEKQVVSTVFWPEYYNEIAYQVDGAGVFISNLTTGKTSEITKLDNQDFLGDIIISFWKNSNLKKRGSVGVIIKKLEESGARVRDISPREVQEAIVTSGKRVMIMDGDFNQVDFISYSMLAALGYRVYTWDGIEYNMDDPDLDNKKIVIIPPGKAGRQILSIVKSLNF